MAGTHFCAGWSQAIRAEILAINKITGVTSEIIIKLDGTSYLFEQSACVF